MLAVCFLSICMNGCSSKNVISDLSQTTLIKIRVHSGSNTYTDYTISDAEAVQSICDTFSSLELKKVKMTEPLYGIYSVAFFKTEGTVAIESLIIVGGKNVIDDGKDLYEIKNDLNIHNYLENIVESAPLA